MKKKRKEIKTEEPWDGVLAADSYGSMSPQGSISGIDGESDPTGTDNNCQNLNIWTPGINDGEKRPVMVWLHGGGFSTGSANEEGYDGEALSRSGDVVVSVNHRLNVFGHLDLSAYDDKYQYSANVGITDIVVALEWIQDNINSGQTQTATETGQDSSTSGQIPLVFSDLGIVTTSSELTFPLGSVALRKNTQNLQQKVRKMNKI